MTPPSNATLLFCQNLLCVTAEIFTRVANHQQEGCVANYTLQRVIDKMAERRTEPNRGLELKKGIKSLKSHLKYDFSTHVEEESTCVWHCTKCALSEAPCSHTRFVLRYHCLTYRIEEWISSVTPRTDLQQKEEVRRYCIMEHVPWYMYPDTTCWECKINMGQKRILDVHIMQFHSHDLNATNLKLNIQTHGDIWMKHVNEFLSQYNSSVLFDFINSNASFSSCIGAVWQETDKELIEMFIPRANLQDSHVKKTLPSLKHLFTV